MADIEKTIEGIETIREFFGFGLQSQDKIFEMYQKTLSDTLELLKEQQEKIRQLESMNVSASGNGTAIGVLHGSMTIKKEYHQQAKKVYNIGHVDRLDF